MTATLNIQNLKCHGCANTIINQLSKLIGISNVTVDNNINTVSFKYNNDTSLNLAKTKLSDLGYPVDGEGNSLGKKAKSFVSCAVGRMSK